MQQSQIKAFALNTDTFTIADVTHITEDFHDTLLATVFLSSSPNHDEPYASYQDSPVRFAITIDFAENNACIVSTGDTFEANVSYTSIVLARFAREFELMWNEYEFQEDASKAVVAQGIESFKVHY